ncbi:L-seryl-tRNA(Sec) selenium transferase [Vagococcus intermedius]|uniref:L-seryl-tRNA(Sec) selenium transferase n=1 Tax=Vagococcus intermedius TaxID=2991418 RepID=A0AAF0I8J1_9ENTE|nr:L-seryl-tRNA(Sec) selenium transferase [Vagococcus intermedius]WEG74204.1 L-seryl-tRNA(Sec) selenium transferase [Vagococcus intermedius]WEG76285.1 L-seryl-tRNA(Sec) selenium transferase [Vagococcus intermedius]
MRKKSGKEKGEEVTKSNLALLPSVSELLKQPQMAYYQTVIGQLLLIEVIRESINLKRQLFLLGNTKVLATTKEENIHNLMIEISRKVKEKQTVNLKRVINATGIVLHTNLGRAILPRKVQENIVQVTSGYTNLEYDIDKGQRGSRYDHLLTIIKELTGAEDALVVNNNAAAVLLVLDTLAKNKEVIVSRGELVEIGGSFRIPNVIQASGCILKEVGTTNKTHYYDFEEIATENTGAILKVHTSNYKIIGFSQMVESKKLANLAASKGIPYVEDLGSGLFIDLSPYGLSHEATVNETIRAGADIVTFSGDKILGGPQAGIIIGKKHYINQIKKNQLTRCLRVDKMVLGALEATFKLYQDEAVALNAIPTLKMLTTSLRTLEITAENWQAQLEKKKLPIEINLFPVRSQVGGGAYPGDSLKSIALQLIPSDMSVNHLEHAMRMQDIPIITRIKEESILLDVRTISEEDWNYIVDSLVAIFHREGDS